MLKIESLDHNGKGITRINNKIVFVENALPGEIVDINIKKEKKNYIEANVLKYIKKSNTRIKSPCPYYNDCGGCDLLHLSYNNQLNFKQEKIENIINKYLNVDIKINNIVSCDNNFNYRNKVTFQVKNSIGFYKKNSYEIIPINYCLICNDVINNSIKYLKKLPLNMITKIICRTGNNKLMIIIETNKKDLNIDCLKSIAHSIYLKINNEFFLVYGAKNIIQKIGSCQYIISPDSFFQINIDVCTKLYNGIKKCVKINNNILDLYCGTGSISSFISDKNNVLGIDINSQSISDALQNININRLSNINFICGDAGKEINKIKNFYPDIIIIDPPRNGLNKETVNNILKFNPKKIIYISCDPMTMVRDLNILNSHYKILDITPFDMFPNTKHIECLTILEKIKCKKL